MNPYDILKIPRNSSKETAKKAFRKLSMIHHPDKGGSRDTFIIIQQAYEKIKNQEVYKKPPVRQRPQPKQGGSYTFVRGYFKEKEYIVDFILENVKRIEIGGTNVYYDTSNRTRATLIIRKEDIKKYKYKVPLKFITYSNHYKDIIVDIPKPKPFYKKLFNSLKKKLGL